MFLSQIQESPLPRELMNKGREDTKLLVINRSSGSYSTTSFSEIVDYFHKGDVLVFNNSKLIRACIPVYFREEEIFAELHIGTSRANGLRLVEVRPKELNQKIRSGSKAEILGTNSTVLFKNRHTNFRRFTWAKTDDDTDLLDISNTNGKLIRYGHIPFDLPESLYENTTGTVPGSVEYPSAARPFTSEILKALKDKGVILADITLHCNLGSLEPFEFEDSDILLDEEYFIPENTVSKINTAKTNGKRVVALGTSAVRTLESGYSKGNLSAGKGLTTLFIRDGYSFKIVDSIVTGMHENQGSHIGMISAFAGRKLLKSAYEGASKDNFSWHEFGDLAIIL